MNADMDILSTLRDAGALKEGHFLLSSGRHSNTYVEKFDLLRQPAATSAACALFADQFRGKGIDVVAGPTTGGIILAFELARQLGVNAAYAERIAGDKTQREFRRGMRFSAGARVLVVDDILTTGGSVQETLRALEMHTVEVVGVAILVDRSGGAVSFEVPLTSLVTMDIATWEPKECPLCRAGEPLVKPGTTPAI